MSTTPQGVPPSDVSIFKIQIRETASGEPRHIVRWRVDGRSKSRSFEGTARKSEGADRYKARLVAAKAAGEPFDKDTGEPVSWGGGDNVFKAAMSYLGPRFEDNSPGWRLQWRYLLTEMVTTLVVPNAPKCPVPTGGYGDDDQLSVWLALEMQGEPHPDPARDDKVRSWIERSSKPIGEVTTDDLQRVLDGLSTSRQPWDAGRKIGADTMNKRRSQLRGMFHWLHAAKTIDHDPSNAIKRYKAKTQADTGSRRVDVDSVFSPAQLWEVFDWWHDHSPGTERYAAAVLLMGFCGARAGEAWALRREDIDLPTLTVTYRGSVRRTYDDKLKDDPDAGPVEFTALKSCDPGDTRSVPIPPAVARWLAWHLDTYTGPAPTDLVFTTTTGKVTHHSAFTRQWAKMRAELWPHQPGVPADRQHPLADCVPHTARHSAVTFWLNAEVPVKKAQLWSGHKSLSIFLDVYAGVMPDDEELGRANFNSWLNSRAAEAGLGRRNVPALGAAATALDDIEAPALTARIVEAAVVSDGEEDAS